VAVTDVRVEDAMVVAVADSNIEQRNRFVRSSFDFFVKPNEKRRTSSRMQ